MRKKTHHAMHIKSRTQGSSNEISLSVLDAASEAQSDGDRDKNAPATGKVSLFTLGKGQRYRSTPTKTKAVGLPNNGSTRVLAAGTTARAVRSEGMWRRVIPVIAVLLVLLVLALAVGQSLFVTAQEQRGLRSVLDEQVSLIEKADDTLLPFDTLVMEQYDKSRLTASAIGDKTPSVEELTVGYRDVVADIAPVRIQLQDAIAEVEALQPSLTENNDKEAAAQAITAARSRLNMLDAGIRIIEESLTATESFLDARAGWDAVINADAAAREATNLMREMSEETVTASLGKTREALDDLITAAASFQSAEADYPGLDLSPYLTYVNKRVESQQAAEAADLAYLDRNKEELAAQNDRYNALEVEAADLAKQLEGDPELIVADRFYAAVAVDAETYDAERLKAGNADAFLRDYLGMGAE